MSYCTWKKWIVKFFRGVPLVRIRTLGSVTLTLLFMYSMNFYFILTCEQINSTQLNSITRMPPIYTRSQITWRRNKKCSKHGTVVCNHHIIIWTSACRHKAVSESESMMDVAVVHLRNWTGDIFALYVTAFDTRHTLCTNGHAHCCFPNTPCPERLVQHRRL